MICPICEIKVENFDDPDGTIRLICCHCKSIITMTELTDDEACQDDQKTD